MHFKRNNSSHSCRTLSTVGHFFVDLDMLNMFAVSTYHLSLIVFGIKDKKY